MGGLKKRMDVPCKDCTERKTGCHGQCEAYKTFRAKMDERIKAADEKRAGMYGAFDRQAVNSRVKKMVKRGQYRSL